MSRFYKDKRKAVWDTITNAYKRGTQFENNGDIIKLETPIKLSITPLHPEKLDEMYNETLTKLRKRGILKYVACYKEDGKIIMERIM